MTNMNDLITMLDNVREELDIYKTQYDILIKKVDKFSNKLPKCKFKELNQIIRDNYNETKFYLDLFVNIKVTKEGDSVC